jgi:hypothetical protein
MVLVVIMIVLIQVLLMLVWSVLVLVSSCIMLREVHLYNDLTSLQRRKTIMNFTYEFMVNSLVCVLQPTFLPFFLLCWVLRFFSLMHSFVFLCSVNTYSTNTFLPFPSNCSLAYLI